MGSSVRMKAFLLLLATAAVFAQDQEVHYSCPMYDIDLRLNDLYEFHGIATWQECAQICIIVGSANCNFWTWNLVDTNGNGSCYLKNSDAGMMPSTGSVSGEKGCTG